MSPDSAGPPETVSATFTLEGEQFRLQSRVTVPAGPTRMSELLPLARGLSDAVVHQTCQALEEAGEKISCQKGCGACCRNLVAISEMEARRIGAVVAGLPEPRRSTIRERFAAAQQRLDQAGLSTALGQPERMTAEEYAALVETYFRQGIDCPFLEDGACSIYEERPITCREYLVTSPPEYCARPGSEGVRKVRLPIRVFNAVARWQVAPTEHLLERWVPLILAPQWAAAHPEEPPPRPGPELLRDLLSQFGT